MRSGQLVRAPVFLSLSFSFLLLLACHHGPSLGRRDAGFPAVAEPSELKEERNL
jgi:hypothetical protein